MTPLNLFLPRSLENMMYVTAYPVNECPFVLYSQQFILLEIFVCLLGCLVSCLLAYVTFADFFSAFLLNVGVLQNVVLGFVFYISYYISFSLAPSGSTCIS